MKRVNTLFVVAVMFGGMLEAFEVHAIASAHDDRAVASIPAVGPRGPVGPDVPLSEAERGLFAKRITVQGHNAEAVQEGCERAVKEGIDVVFLPAGQYVFEGEVRVPGGITLVGEGSQTPIRTGQKNTCLFRVDGDLVRFTRLKLIGADTSPNADNDTCGISASGKENIRVDHCELFGFRYAMSFVDEAAAQVDHCLIHHNLRAGQGYGVLVMSGAYLLISDNEFGQNRHSLATNGALDWSSPKRLGKYIHIPGVRKTHWEFIRNRVGSNDKALYEHSAVDTHPGMDGTFVVQGNVFENLRHGIGIWDGSGLISHNVFRNLRTVTKFCPLVAISVSYGTHNNIPVEGCMPHNIQVEGNIFRMPKDVKYQKYSLGKAENITIDGKLVPETKAKHPAPLPLPFLTPMDAEGKLGIRKHRPVSSFTVNRKRFLRLKCEFNIAYHLCSDPDAGLELNVTEQELDEDFERIKAIGFTHVTLWAGSVLNEDVGNVELVKLAVRKAAQHGLACYIWFWTAGKPLMYGQPGWVSKIEPRVLREVLDLVASHDCNLYVWA